jgi:hypothetical protein
MKYAALKHRYIVVEKETQITASVNGSVLVPEENTKTFLHWVNENGKLISTYTLSYPTLVHDQVKLINGSKKPVKIHVIDL